VSTLVRYSLRWPNPTKVQQFTIEALSAENLPLLKGQVPDADLERPDFFISRHPGYGLTILEEETRTCVFFSPLEMFRRHWACPKYRGQLVSWTPESDLFRLW
jgi:hypothetical protein